jgi:hypothetical protein
LAGLEKMSRVMAHTRRGGRPLSDVRTPEETL